MNKKQRQIIVVEAVLMVLFSLVSFAVPFQRTGLFWIAYLFGMLSIFVQGYALKVAFLQGNSVKSKFYGFPIAKTGIIYMIIQLVLSLTFMALAEYIPIWIGGILFVIIFAVGALGVIGANASRNEIERQDLKLETDTSCMVTLRSLVYPLVSHCEDAGAKKALTDLAEEFRYSDPVSDDSLKTIESELEMSVSELQMIVASNSENQIVHSCIKVSSLLAERNRLCK